MGSRVRAPSLPPVRLKVVFMATFFVLVFFICLLKAVIYLFNCKYYILCPFNALRKIYPKFCIKKAIIYERWWPFVVLILLQKIWGFGIAIVGSAIPIVTMFSIGLKQFYERFIPHKTGPCAVNHGGFSAWFRKVL